MQVSLTVGMPEALMDDLMALAVKRGVSRNALIKEGIKMLLECDRE